MKKLMAFILVIASLSCFAFAEGIDLGGMSINELYKLQESVDSEIRSRINCAESSNDIHTGVYVVGEDIKSGRFILTVSTNDTFEYYLYKDEASKKNNDYIQYGWMYLDAGKTVECNLKDGMILYITNFC